jgi:hypothetical protein
VIGQESKISGQYTSSILRAKKVNQTSGQQEMDVLLLVEVEVNLRPTVSLPVRLGIGPPYGTLDQVLSCSSFFC